MPKRTLSSLLLLLFIIIISEEVHERIRHVALVQHFIRAECTGDWRLHLCYVRQIFPYFHAAGNLHYDKSGRLCLQQMKALEQIMPHEKCKFFTEKDYFSIRRRDSFWSGNCFDKIIEV